MKAIKTKLAVNLVSIAFLIVSISNLSFSVKKDQLAKFQILVEADSKVLKFSRKDGATAWRETSFDLKVGDTQAMNQFGMTSLEEDDLEKDPKLADFLFTVERTANGLKFKGIRGTAWKELSWSCPTSNCNQLIDQYGMVAKGK